jgi:subtilase family serine protease
MRSRTRNESNTHNSRCARRKSNLLLWGSAAAIFLFSSALFAQENRIMRTIDNSHRATIRGNIHPKAQPQFDKGPVEASFRLNCITLLLKKSASQQADLERLLHEQQDPSSTLYHHWLTPEQYADRFGVSQSDIEEMSNWLNSSDLTVMQVAKGRDFIVFSGSSQQVETALHTPIHRYEVEGKIHYANAAEPSVPEAFAHMVAGFWGLHDFHPKPLIRGNPKTLRGMPNAALQPHFAVGTGENWLAPDDLTTIYNVAPLYQYGLDGTGQTLVIAGQTDIDLTDIDVFRSAFNLPPNEPIKVPVWYSPVGIIDNQVGEADLDLEWSGAIARNARMLFVYSQNAFDSVQYAVDNNLGPVISFSFGECEGVQASLEYTQWVQSIAQKANLEGITWVASSGDAGAAGCENQNGQTSVATTGLHVNLPASVPEVTGVGGTEFAEGFGSYWSQTPSANYGSALSYIPEISWNDASLKLAAGVSGFAASGGGVSTFFAKPDWQIGLGVPSDGRRDVPDVAVTASWLHDAYSLFTKGNWSASGGTSAAAPSFAGMLVLLNQYLTSAGVQSGLGLGNINPYLYWLAQNTTGVFHDITTGSNMVSCQLGTSDCYSGVLGYTAGPGYDQVTGLGSVDAYNLVTTWAAEFAPAITSMR